MTNNILETVPLRKRFQESLLSIDRVLAREIMKEAIALGPQLDAIEQVIVPAFENIGSGWEKGTVSLSQVYMSGRICEELVDALFPQANRGKESQPILAIAVLEDHHFLGKRIVYSAVRAAGFALIDYGHVTVEEIVHQVQRDRTDILMISVLMLPSALRVAELKKALRSVGHPVTLIVGGAPFRFDEQLWREVGADAMGRTASDVLPLLETSAAEMKKRVGQ